MSRLVWALEAEGSGSPVKEAATASPSSSAGSGPKADEAGAWAAFKRLLLLSGRWMMH